ncbi:MAG: LptA/OstA family protein [Gemmatimonadota bacterium]
MKHHSAARAAGVTVAALLLAVGGARAQQNDQPVVIDHTDELRRIVEGDSLTYVLEGSVRAHRGPIQMRSQRAVISRKSGLATFERSVHFWDRTTELYADHLVYNEITDVAVATGRVQVIDRQSGSQVKADTVHYDRRESLVIARPRPQMVLLPEDTTAQEPFTVWADEMRFRSDSTSSELHAVRRVLIERSDLTAIGDSLYYSKTAGVVALRIAPQVETANTYLTADRIDVALTDNAISALIALQGARAINKADTVPAVVPPAFNNVSQTSFLEGDSIHIAFVDDAIEWLVAAGHARSLNYARESADGTLETWSVNYLLGDHLRLTFDGDTLDQVVATGGSRGVYRSEAVQVGGPQRRESEPIPLPELSAAAWTPGPVRGVSDHRGRRRSA